MPNVFKTHATRKLLAERNIFTSVGLQHKKDANISFITTVGSTTKLSCYLRLAKGWRSRSANQRVSHGARRCRRNG